MALARAQACLLYAAVLLTNVAGPDRPDNHLRRACLELLPPILSSTAALLGPGLPQSYPGLATQLLVSALPRDQNDFRVFLTLASTLVVRCHIQAQVKRRPCKLGVPFSKNAHAARIYARNCCDPVFNVFAWSAYAVCLGKPPQISPRTE